MLRAVSTTKETLTIAYIGQVGLDFVSRTPNLSPYLTSL